MGRCVNDGSVFVVADRWFGRRRLPAGRYAVRACGWPDPPECQKLVRVTQFTIVEATRRRCHGAMVHGFVDNSRYP
jgi:hypothetical protein